MRSPMPDSVPLPQTLLDRFERLGIDVSELLRRAGIPRSRFAATTPHGTTAELFALWVAAAELGGRNLGLRAGSDPAPQHQNVATLAALHSPTLGEGLAKLARYKRLVCPEEVSIELTNREARLRFEWLLADGVPPPMLIDAVFSGVAALAQRGTGAPLRPLRLELTRRRTPEDERMLVDHFHCAVRFDARFDLLVLDQAALALPMLTRNAQLVAMLVPGLESALEQEGGARTLADDVRAALGQTIHGERPHVEGVARSLGMSRRTLQRRLGDLGTTYQRLLDEVRHRSARRLLASTDLGTGEVAFLLGFEGLNSFTRAFQAWEGTTPTRWRASAR